jgi:antitoxin (DNA-binding transcriptional repressor) of toxin-antitoxin stability system
MKFVGSRDVRNNPGQLREAVEREDVVLTASGKPFAIAIGVGEDQVEETLELLRRVRAGACHGPHAGAGRRARAFRYVDG